MYVRMYVCTKVKSLATYARTYVLFQPEASTGELNPKGTNCGVMIATVCRPLVERRHTSVGADTHVSLEGVKRQLCVERLSSVQ